MVRRIILHLFLLTLAASGAWAQAEPAPNIQSQQGPGAEPKRFYSRIRGLFDIELPELDPPGTVKLIFHPHVSDLVRRDYLRTDAGLRWALNDYFELSAEAATFVTHGLGDSGDGYGVGKIRLGTKYIFKDWLRPKYEASVSLGADLPVGHPPFDMTDGHNHLTPAIVIQHHSDRHPKLTTFAGTGLDLVSSSSVAGAFQPNQPQDDSVSLTLGGIYDLGQLKWTLSGTYATTALLGDTTEHFFYLRPSVLWYVPRKMTLNSKTQWIVGLGAPLTWGPDGFEFKVNSRLRAEITFRQVLAKMRLRYER
jgi:hypothetical protein